MGTQRRCPSQPHLRPLGIKAWEIAAHMGCTVKTFHRRRKLGEFDVEPLCVSWGYGMTWSRAEVERWLEERGYASGGDA